jgi:acyl-CoA synthetase (AMP-forming)/AMP-acid ligase II
LNSEVSPFNFLFNNDHLVNNTNVLITENDSISWEELSDEIDKIAWYLISNGIKPYQRIACIFDDSIKFFKVMFGIWAAGGIVVPVNRSILNIQRQIIIDKLQPHFIISSHKDFIDIEYDMAKKLILPDCLPDINPSCYTRYTPKSNDCAMIMFTSGTTGIPKGVINTHFSLAENCRLTSEMLNITHRDRIFINTPVYYTSTICHFLTMLSKSASVFFHNGFLFDHMFFELIKKYKCTGFGGAPTHFNRFFSGSLVDIKKPELFRFVMSSGDHLPAYLIKRVATFFPELEIYNVYGLSEVSGRLFFLKPIMQKSKAGSVGKSFDCMSIKILNDDLKICAAGEVGEIFVKGPLLAKEYFQDTANTKKLKTKFGFKTGDIGYFDSDGFLYLQGRNDDIFKSGGEKVSTLMIQQALAKLEEFDDIAVISIKDEMLMKIPVAFYVLKKEFSFNKKNVTKKMKQTLPSNHIPAKFIEVSMIPRTGSGKTIRSELEKQFV